MINNIVPGHFRAFTVWACLVLGVLAYMVTNDFISVVGLELLLLGLFFGDQSTHLGQENHYDMPSTKIEKWMQDYKIVFLSLSFVVSVLGLLLLIK